MRNLVANFLPSKLFTENQYLTTFWSRTIKHSSFVQRVARPSQLTMTWKILLPVFISSFPSPIPPALACSGIKYFNLVEARSEKIKYQQKALSEGRATESRQNLYINNKFSTRKIMLKTFNKFVSLITFTWDNFPLWREREMNPKIKPTLSSKNAIPRNLGMKSFFAARSRSKKRARVED